MIKSFRTLPITLMVALLLIAPVGVAKAEHPTAIGTTRVAQWKDDKQAAFTMGFDDGIADQLTLVIPELQKRKMVATFYLNPGKGEYVAVKSQWEKAPETGVAVLGDHTMTHSGVKDFANAEVEIGQCDDIILGMNPAGKVPRLISFAQPGVPPGHWNITGEEYKQILAEHHLIDRGDYRGHGAMFHEKTADEMVGLADRALANGGVEYIVFHSIGPGTIPTPLPIFLEFLDKLETRHDRLWIIDHISAYKYETERNGAQVQVLGATDDKISLSLKSTADPQLFDFPLTLITQVSAKSPQYQVTQGIQKTTVTAANSAIQFDALPNGDPIVIQPIGAP
jgi:hypothetical protein